MQKLNAKYNNHDSIGRNSITAQCTSLHMHELTAQNANNFLRKINFACVRHYIHNTFSKALWYRIQSNS